MTLRSHRNAIGISQSSLARMSRVSRFKICLFELDGGSLTDDEKVRISEALKTEAERLRQLSTQFDFSWIVRSE